MQQHDSQSTDVVLAAGQSGEEIRRLVLGGAVLIVPPIPETLALAEFTRQLLADAFDPIAPPVAHSVLDPAQLSDVLGRVKPLFTHHPRSWELMADVVRALGLDDGELYADVPRVRMSVAGDHLRVGMAHAQPPHRDTWWGSPFCQLNFWGPVHEMAPGTGMDLYPVHFQRPIANSSDRFDVHHWQTVGRRQAGSQLGPVDTRGIPEPLEAPTGGAFSPTLPVGGLLVFSGAHLHATRPNRSNASRVSIDFRVLSGRDLVDRAGPPNLDSRCTGSAIGDFRHLATQRPVPESWCRAAGLVPPSLAPPPAAA